MGRAVFLDRLEVTGEPFPIGEGVEPTVARDGTLSFLGDPDTMVRQLSWFTMDGRLGAVLAEPREWSEGFAISKDGRRVLAATVDGIWAYDAATGARSRVTNGRTDLSPTWVGLDAIAFVRTEANDPVIVFKQLNDGSEGCSHVGRAFRTSQTIGAASGSTSTTAHARRGRSGGSIPTGARKFIGSERRISARDSPASRRTAVSSPTCPAKSAATRCSSRRCRAAMANGRFPRTAVIGRSSRRGDAVVYRAPDGAFMSVPIEMAGAEVKIGQPRKLFDWGAGWKLDFALAADGLRGVAAVPSGKSTRVPSISVVQHWEREFSMANADR